jgi:hypothetical protein
MRIEWQHKNVNSPNLFAVSNLSFQSFVHAFVLLDLSFILLDVELDSLASIVIEVQNEDNLVESSQCIIIQHSPCLWI